MSKTETSFEPPNLDSMTFGLNDPYAPAPVAGRMVTDRHIGLLRIERQANGGWLVEGRKDVQNNYMTRSDLSGAFTSTADMLRALADLLERDDEKRKEQANG